VKLRVALTLQRVFQRWVQEGSGGSIEKTQPEKNMVVKSENNKYFSQNT